MIFQRLDDVGNTDDDGDDDECYNCKSSKCMTAPTPLGSIVCCLRKKLFVQTKLERGSRKVKVGICIMLDKKKVKVKDRLIVRHLCKDFFMRSGDTAMLLASEDFGDDERLKVLLLHLSDVTASCLKHV